MQANAVQSHTIGKITTNTLRDSIQTAPFANSHNFDVINDATYMTKCIIASEPDVINYATYVTKYIIASEPV